MRAKVIVKRTSGHFKNVQCGCGHLTENLFVTETRFSTKHKFVFVRMKAFPYVCTACNCSANMMVIGDYVRPTETPKLELSETLT